VIDYAALRLNMIEGQMRPNRVTEPALVEVLGQMPRERFVPEPLRPTAYVDEDLPLGGGRFLTEPLVLARLIQAIRVKPGAKVLDIGCTTGYGAAVLARLGARVTALDGLDMAARARANLAELGVTGVEVVSGPLRDGWRAGAPYDGIIIEGGVARVPDALFDQLAPGGCIATVLTGEGAGRLVAFAKLGDGIARRDLFDAAVPALAAFAPEPGFVF
jgi:protein-L-isoaspartate(D-aspartate) O-methyltransferase